MFLLEHGDKSTASQIYARQFFALGEDSKEVEAFQFLTNIPANIYLKP